MNFNMFSDSEIDPQFLMDDKLLELLEGPSTNIKMEDFLHFGTEFEFREADDFYYNKQSPAPEKIKEESTTYLYQEILDDKKRRNTEASARFRIRKKAKDLQRRKLIKELQVKIDLMRKNIDTLEKDNKSLKETLAVLNERESEQLVQNIKLRANANF